MKISVLIPARNGYAALEKSISSIYDNESKQNNIKVIVKMDNDDIGTINLLLTHKYFNNITLVVSDRLRGYQDIHNFYNDMAKLEDDSDFFLIFNSDAMIKTLNWDLLLKSYNPGDYLILHHNMVNGRGSGDYFFPIISQAYYKLCGFISLVYDYDGYLYNMALKAGIRTTINLDIEHFNAEYDLDSMKTAHEYIRTRDNTIFNKEFNRVLNIIKKV